jgi:uncharacterized protein (TIGR04255 family)
MPLAFPSFDHVTLQNPPLKEVVCQIRFPIILKLGESPIDFQEAIRDRFPNFGVEHGVAFEVSSDPNQSINPQVIPKVYRFLDEDETRTVSLSAGFYALSTTRYSGWQSFVSDLKFISERVLSIYKPRFTTRIGLRYINVLNANNTQASSFVDVLRILRPEITALVVAREFQEPDFSLTHVRTRHEDGIFSFRSGIFREENTLSFLLDFDQYFEEQIELNIDDLLQRCDRFHTLLYNAFRWSFRDGTLPTFSSTE